VLECRTVLWFWDWMSASVKGSCTYWK